MRIFLMLNLLVREVAARFKNLMNAYEKFYVLLTVHHVMILGNDQRDTQISSLRIYFYL